MNATSLKAGDFTGLAENYSKYRADYCPSILNGLVGLLEKPGHECDFVDVGAGTGIWTRMVLNYGVKSAVAIEPNDEMRSIGISDSANQAVQWLKGSAEHTELSDASCDWLTMASSFHWANFDKATREFSRVLRPGGRFSALWNPRLVEVNPLLVEIENHLSALQPKIERVSSGRSGITQTLTKQLWTSSHFDDVVYLEGRHVINMSPQRYLGLWRSVNDLRVQLGESKFDKFLMFIENRLKGVDTIEATYLTRAWSARRKSL